MFSGSRVQLAIKVAKISKTDMAGVSDNDVVENFNFQKLTCSDEIAGDFNVRLGWSWNAARMIVANDDC